jgi:hypothetical protein
MILIAHRGNIEGKVEEYENNPTYIEKAINEGFDVEIDIWFVNGLWYLGHDNPQYVIGLDWLMSRTNKLWIHCKNLNSLSEIKKYDLHYFWHENDEYTLTSKKYIWAFPSKENKPGTISVLPEMFNTPIHKCEGVCSDFVKKYLYV